MTDQERIEAKSDLAELVANYIEGQMTALHTDAGIPWDVILAGCHAQIVAAMTLHLGGPATFATIQWAAQRIHDLPSARDATLAYAVPAGRA